MYTIPYIKIPQQIDMDNLVKLYRIGVHSAKQCGDWLVRRNKTVHRPRLSLLTEKNKRIVFSLQNNNESEKYNKTWRSHKPVNG